MTHSKHYIRKCYWLGFLHSNKKKPPNYFESIIKPQVESKVPQSQIKIAKV